MPVITAVATTHCGLVRGRNEDTLVLPGLISVGTVPASQCVTRADAGRCLYAVVDGMGGGRGGQEASRLVGQYLLDHLDNEISVLLSGANRLLYDEMLRTPSLVGMGATVAGVLLEDLNATVFNVGDVRVYQMADGCLMRVSVDDRLSAESNIVTQSLGGSERRTDVSPHTTLFVFSLGQTLLICSDGLSDVVTFDVIQSVLAEEGALGAPSRLLQAALDKGAPDNVSIITLELGDE